MNIRTSIFAVPATLIVLSLLANCSSSDSPATNTGGAPAATGGASAGAGGAKAGAAGAATAGAFSSAGSPSAGASSGGASSGGSGGQAIAGGAGSGTAGGAAAGAAGGAAIPATFATVQNVIQTTSCFGGGCHDDPANPLQLKVDANLYMTLTTHVTKTCGKLVNTASPADSGLVKLLQGDCNGTVRMPYGKCYEGDVGSDFCVSDANIAAIQAWIAKGAPQQ